MNVREAICSCESKGRMRAMWCLTSAAPLLPEVNTATTIRGVQKALKSEPPEPRTTPPPPASPVEVKIYTAGGVTAELERSKQEYLQAAIMVSGGARKIALPDLLLMNMTDFAADKESLMEWVCQQQPTSGALRKSIVDCFRSSHGRKGAAAAVVEKIAYEFEFQYLLVV